MYEKGSNFLHRLPTGVNDPWIIGPTVGSGAGGVFFQDSPQCPVDLVQATVFTGGDPQFETLLPEVWSASCDPCKYQLRTIAMSGIECPIW